MPHYRNWFPSKYVCAEDLNGQDAPVTIERIGIEEMPNGDGEQKPVLYFTGCRKGLVLNKTNAKRIAQMYGNDTNAWIGHEIVLYPSETDLRGETVPCIRVRLVEQPALGAQPHVSPPVAPEQSEAPQQTEAPRQTQSDQAPRTPQF